MALPPILHGSRDDWVIRPGYSRNSQGWPNQEELTKAKRRHEWSVQAMLDDPDAVASFYGLAALAGIARTPMARHEDLARVTASDVRAAAEAVFRGDRMSVVAVGLLKDADLRKLERAVRTF